MINTPKNKRQQKAADNEDVYFPYFYFLFFLYFFVLVFCPLNSRVCGRCRVIEPKDLELEKGERRFGWKKRKNGVG